MRKFYTLLIVSLILCLFTNSRQGLKAQTLHPDYLDGNIYLKLEDTTSINLDPYTFNIPVLNLILTTFGVDSLYRPFKSGHPALQNIYRLEFTNILGADNLITQLELLGFVDYAEKVPLNIVIGGTVLTPNDLQPNQWSLTKINAPMAWGMTLGNSAIKVAVVDNAIRATHQDLSSVIWTNPNEVANLLDDDLNGYPDDVHGYDVADFDNNVNPPVGGTGWDHGSHCSGVAGAATDNGIGMASIGYGITIIPVKATNDAAGGNTLTKAFEGVDYARAAGADVISMSWGSNGISATGNLILSLANNAGILLVAAAGNNNDSVPFYPAASANVLAVGSTDQADIRSSFSNYGAYIDVMAPGSDIYSCLGTGDSDYGFESGTSMACPLVAGLAGLIWSMAPGLTAQQVTTMIIDGCVNIDALNPGFAGKLGAGRINAFNSLLATGLDQEQLATPSVICYPNPTRSDLKMTFPQAWQHESVDVTVYDASGTLKYSGELHPLDAKLDCAAWASGIYWVQFQQGVLRHTALVRVD